MIDLRFRPIEAPIAPPGGKHRKDDFGAGWTRTLDDLERELRLLAATEVVVEAGFRREQIRNDGWPRGGAAAWTPGVRLFFQSKHGPMRFECGAFRRYEANMRAIGLVLQDLRLMKERGVGSGVEQYRGYSALPQSIQAEEWSSQEEAARWLHGVVHRGDTGSQLNALQIVEDPAVLERFYRAAAKVAHPDAGGSNDLMAKVNRAKDYIERGH